MFHERRADGSWLHGFERRDSDGKITRKFSEALMADIRRNRVALRKLGEWMCREPKTPGVKVLPAVREGETHSEKVCHCQTATPKRGREFHRTKQKTQKGR